MIVLSGALVLVALVLLVFGALDRNLPYVYASIGVSVLSLLLLVVGILQRRGELAGDDDAAMTPVTETSGGRVPALVGAGPEQSSTADTDAAERTAELQVPAAAQAPASRRVTPDAGRDLDVHEHDRHDEHGAGQEDLDEEGLDEDDQYEGDLDEVDEDDVQDELDEDDVEDEDEVQDEDEDDVEGVTVLVVSGRPRYHVDGCRVLRGKQAQPLDRGAARTHGFSPCGVCKPDADEDAVQPEPPTPAQPATAATPVSGDGGGGSFTEALFGEPLFADRPADGADRTSSQALPDRPVQPVSVDVVPAASPSAPAVDEPSADLHGDDPADDATPVPEGDDATDPAVVPDEVAVDGEPDAAAPSPADDTPEPPAADAPEPLHGDDPADEPSVADDGEPAVIDTSPAAELVAAPEEGDADPGDAAVDDAPAPVEATDTPTEVPAEPAPAETAPAQAAAKKAPAKKAPAKKAPARKAAAKKAPAKKAAAKKAPAEKAAAKKAPAKKAPVTKAAATKTAASAAPAPAAPKRPLVRTVRADALRLGAPSTGVTTTRVSARAAAPAVTSAPVVVVPDRDRFHRPDCRFVRDVAGASSLPKASATRQGYAACGVCKP